jgi:anthraniloyl-CoA monooxygenase
MPVGNISDWDQVNSILMAGRADLVCLARMHLANPYWTLHAAIEQGDRMSQWPAPYQGGKILLQRLRERQQETIRV